MALTEGKIIRRKLMQNFKNHVTQFPRKMQTLRIFTMPLLILMPAKNKMFVI